MKTLKTLMSLSAEPESMATSTSSAPKAGAPRPTRHTGMVPSQLEIEHKAYEIWMAEGQQHGQDQRHWFEAERQLRRH